MGAGESHPANVVEVRLVPLGVTPAGGSRLYARLHSAADGVASYGAWGSPQVLGLWADDVVTVSFYSAKSDWHFNKNRCDQFAEVYLPWDNIHSAMQGGTEAFFSLGLDADLPWLEDESHPSRYKEAFRKATEMARQQPSGPHVQVGIRKVASPSRNAQAQAANRHQDGAAAISPPDEVANRRSTPVFDSQTSTPPMSISNALARQIAAPVPTSPVPTQVRMNGLNGSCVAPSLPQPSVPASSSTNRPAEFLLPSSATQSLPGTERQLPSASTAPTWQSTPFLYGEQPNGSASGHVHRKETNDRFREHSTSSLWFKDHSRPGSDAGEHRGVPGRPHTFRPGTAQHSLPSSESTLRSPDKCNGANSSACASPSLGFSPSIHSPSQCFLHSSSSQLPAPFAPAAVPAYTNGTLLPPTAFQSVLAPPAQSRTNGIEAIAVPPKTSKLSSQHIAGSPRHASHPAEHIDASTSAVIPPTLPDVQHGFAFDEMRPEDMKLLFHLQVRNQELRAQLAIADNDPVLNVNDQINAHIGRLRQAIYENYSLKADLQAYNRKLAQTNSVLTEEQRMMMTGALAPPQTSLNLAVDDEEYERRVSALTHEIQNVTMCNLDLVSRCDEQIKSLEAELIAARQQQVDALSQRSSIMSAVDERNAVTKLQKQAWELQKVDDECDQLQTSIAQRLAQRWESDARMIQQLRFQHDVQSKKIESLRQVLRTFKSEDTLVMPGTGDLRNEADKLQEEIQMLQEQIDNEELQGAHEQASSEQAQVELRSDAEAARRELDAIVLEVESVERELERLRKPPSESQVAVDHLPVMPEEGLQQKRSLEKDMARWQRKAGFFIEKITKLQEESRCIHHRVELVLQAGPDLRFSSASRNARTAELQEYLEQLDQQQCTEDMLKAKRSDTICHCSCQ